MHTFSSALPLRDGFLQRANLYTLLKNVVGEIRRYYAIREAIRSLVLKKWSSFFLSLRTLHRGRSRPVVVSIFPVLCH